jgi:hypothetical protein
MSLLRRITLVTLAWSSLASAVQPGELPGEDVSGTIPVVRENDKVTAAAPAARPTNWLSPPVDEQLSRDRTLIPLGKGALFLPTYTEPRREPEISVLNERGRVIQSGTPGERILLDSGSYEVHYGSGTVSQQMQATVTIEEGHTTVIPPTWGGLIVETLTQDGEYFEGQYELIRMERWINYGKGHGLTEERLQDIKAWIIPPGTYRISKAGEGFNSLKNYVTVQINPGELSVVELISPDKASGDIIAGGIKALNARTKVGHNWTYGLRAGGNVNLHQETNDADASTQTTQFAGDMRLRVNFDNVQYFGTTELFLQDNFSKEKGKPFSLTTDIAQLRSTWVRRLNPWLGPYVRGTIETHLFPTLAQADTVRVRPDLSSPALDTITPGRDFEVAAVLDPLKLREGAGVNIDFISKYYLEATTQVGVAARQSLVRESFVANSANIYEPDTSTFEIGVENSIIARIRLGNQVTLDLRSELFAPNADVSKIRLDEFTADFRFFLSRNVEIDYLFQIKENETQTPNRYPRSHNLSLRLSFNY